MLCEGETDRNCLFSMLMTWEERCYRQVKEKRTSCSPSSSRPLSGEVTLQSVSTILLLCFDWKLQMITLPHHRLISWGVSVRDVLYVHCICITVCVFQEAVIAPVSTDVLYLFRVQAVCLNDKRSDFSQSMLFRGTELHLHTDKALMNATLGVAFQSSPSHSYLCSLFW